MTNSLRRIANLTLVAGAFIIAAATLAFLGQNCSAENCVASVLFGISQSPIEVMSTTNVGVSTAAVLPAANLDPVGAIQLIGMYLVTLAVLVLVVVEFVQPHYFRRLRSKLVAC